MDQAQSVGDRIQAIRKRRGLTQRQLAQLSGISLSLIRKLEQEERDDARMETIRKLAAALKVPTSALMTTPDADPADPQTVKNWEPVRRALFAPAAQPDEPATTEGVLAALAALQPAVAANRYAEVRDALPLLLRDSQVLNGHSRDACTRVLNLTGWMLVQTRQWDAAEAALNLAIDAADDRLDAAAAVNTMCWSLLRQGRLAEARVLATRWADDIEPRFSRATTAELALWGRLLLGISNAAIRDARPGEAQDSIKLARAAADAIGREITSDHSTSRTFGPATVAMIKAENAAVIGQYDKVLTIARTIPPHTLNPSSASRCRHRLDVAHAQAQTRQYQAAVATIRQLRSAAPEWLTQQRYARDILGHVISRRRTLTPDMRDLADFMAVAL